MRKWWWLVAVLLLGAAVAVVWPSTPAPQTSTGTAELAPLPTFAEVPVTAQDDEGLSLSGRVLDNTGRPVARAQVHLASSLQQSLATVKCGECELPLLSCPARETVPRVIDSLQRSQGLLTPALSTQTDEEGRFKFEHLKGVDFSVWAEAEGLGAAVRERAAPGEPIDLYLPPLRTLRGEVVNEQGERVAGAHVHAVSTRLPLSREANADGNGRFEVSGLGEGPFTVFASAPGYLPSSQTPVEAGPRTTRLKLVAPRTLEVEVKDRGKPADATLELFGDHLSRRVTTKNGFARIEGLYPDQLVLTAANAQRSSEPRTLTLSESVTRVQLELADGGRVFVSTVDESGDPVKDAEVYLRARTGELVARKKVATGELAIFGPIAHGNYTVEAYAEGFKPATRPVVLDSAELALELELAKGIVISGRVLDVYGRAAPRISVLVMPTGESVYADEEGAFSVAVPSVGLYTLMAHHSDWGGGQKQTTAPASGVELQLEPKGQVEVTVQSEGRRVEGAHVVMWVERDGVFRSDRPSGPDGLVPMRGMPPGTYWLAANHDDFIPSDRQRVEVRDGDLLQVTAELKEGASIKGEVVDTQGAPVSGAVLSSIPRGTEPATSDAEGRFELRTLRPGRSYRVEARHPNFDQETEVEGTPGETPVKIVLQRRELFRGRVLTQDGSPIKRYRIDEHDVSSPDGRFELPLPSVADRVIFAIEAPGYEPLMVDRPPAPDLGDFVLDAAPQLTGRVVQEGAGPVAEAVVSCDVCEASVLTQADGSFVLSAPAFVTRFNLMAKKGGLTAALEVEKDAGGPFELTLRRATRLTGVVYGKDGQPQPGVEVVGVSLDRAEPLSLVTGADGTYSAEVPPGAYRFSSGSRPDFAGEPWLLVEVRGEQMRLDLGSPPGAGSLSIELQPERGRALWVVRGEVQNVGNPPGEGLRPEWALLVYQPRGNRIVVPGLPPGRYTVIYGHYYVATETGPLVRSVDVRGVTELKLQFP